MVSSPGNRIKSIDLLRGCIMLVMALDHTRDYFHVTAHFYQPDDPTQASLPLFFTRWITRFCAPAFIFLAGLSAFFFGRSRTIGELSSFLWKR
jgi:uncharacterized membrane protein